MKKFDARFYWDTAKLFFSVVGGGTAGYYLVKGVNSAASKAAQLAEMQVGARLMSATADEETTGDEQLSV